MARLHFGTHDAPSVDEEAANRDLHDKEGTISSVDGDEMKRHSGNISKPTKRLRWATQRVKGESGVKKRMSIMKRFHKRTESEEEKRNSNGSSTVAEEEEESGESEDHAGRTIYFNIPLPEDAKDEEGNPKTRYPRNKIRTAKYTPLSFVPKNLWFQFHNIANVYFLFIIILSVRALSCL